MTTLQLTHFAQVLLRLIPDAELRAQIAEAQAAILSASERAGYLMMAGLADVTPLPQDMKGLIQMWNQLGRDIDRELGK